MLYINLFPRTGSAFLATLATKILDTEVSVIREPQKYSEDINQIVVFRDPYETISSLVYKSRRAAYEKDSNISWTYGIEEEIEHHIGEYLRFINPAIENIDKLIIGTFDKVMADPEAFLKLAGNKYNIKELEQSDAVKQTIDELKKEEFSNNSPGEGHYLRDKDKNRLLIEDIVKSITTISECIDRYTTLYDRISTNV